MAAASGGRLAASVAVLAEDGVETVWFRPGDDVPAWAAKQITNPAAWETVPKGVKLDESDPWFGITAPAPAADDSADDGDAELSEPPLGGPGSGRAEWAAYAEGLGIEVPEDAGRDDIVDLVRAQQ